MNKLEIKWNKTKRVETAILIGVLIGFLVGILVGPRVFAPVSPNLRTDDWPAGYSYVVKTDSTNYWAVKYDGDIAFEGTNFTDVMYDMSVQLLSDGGGEVLIAEGTYYGQIYIPHQTSNKYIGFTGQGRLATRIIGNGDANNEGIIHSGQTAWLSGGSWLGLHNLRISLNNAGEDYGIYTGYQKVLMDGVRVDGTWSVGTTYGAWVGAGIAGGADAGPSHIGSLEIRITGTGPDYAFQAIDENLRIDSLGVHLLTGNVGEGVHLAGEAISIGNLGIFIGEGRSMTTAIVTSTVHIQIDQIYATTSGAGPASYPTFFDVDAGSSVGINNFFVSAGYRSTLWADATTRQQTSIEGSFNGESTEQVFTAVTNGTWESHDFDADPYGAVATGTVVGEIISILDMNATHIQFGVITHAGAAGTSQTVYVKFRP